MLEAARHENLHVFGHLAPHRGGRFEVDPQLDVLECQIAPVVPPPANQRPENRIRENPVIEPRVDTARQQRVVPFDNLLKRKISGRISRMRKNAAAGYVYRVHARIRGPFADLDRIFQLIAAISPRI